jgi:hypothetical protein
MIQLESRTARENATKAQKSSKSLKILDLFTSVGTSSQNCMFDSNLTN